MKWRCHVLLWFVSDYWLRNSNTSSRIVPPEAQAFVSLNSLGHFHHVTTRFSQSKKPKATSLVRLNGIRGFRSWFESQFPNAIFTIEHSHVRQQTEQFHHVLIDMNQLLHITLRRSRSDEHALTLLIKELDKYMEIASPMRSIVLAFDGPPAAAKLATQRRRRLNTVIRAERKRHRLEILKKRGLVVVPRLQKENLKRKSKAAKEEETLKITPGTEFMQKAHEAVLYWAWQRLDSPRGKISHCRIYICPSNVPGEGEVKLLDWLLQAGSDRRMMRVMRKGELELEYHRRIVRPGESVAILGGDSDLVLEGLVIPPTITHNVFVILPSTGKISHVVSLWETTLTLGQYLGGKFDPSDIMRVRTDLVLLLIMNGNDYLPKLRGSAGFNKLFHNYLRLLKNWIKEDNVHRPYLVDPDTLEFNLPFCLSYFMQLASIAPKQLSQPLDVLSNQNSVTPLSQLYSMSDAGFLPSPVVFRRIPSSRGKPDRLRMTLGEDGEQTQGRFHFDLEYDAVDTPTLKKLKQNLAHMALVEILGDDYMELNDSFEDDNVGDDDEDFDDGTNVSGVYPWEISLPAVSSVDEYLRGLLWNLSTYQDGVCSDYGYNYGRRLSPTAEEIVAYFENALRTNKRVNRESLQGEMFVEPLSSGLSCLAALPSQVDFLIPEPYRQLSADATIEDIYAQCMNPMNNVFDISLFKNLCTRAIQQRGSIADSFHEKKIDRKSNLRKVRLGDTFWTVIQKVQNPLKSPYEPPKPFSDRLSNLRFNPCIKVSHILATDKPRWLQFKAERKRTQKLTNDDMESRNYIAGRYCNMMNLLGSEFGGDSNLEDVGYKMVYHSKNGIFSNDRKERFDSSLIKSNREQASIAAVESLTLNSQNVQLSKLNSDGFNAIECLQQLKDAHLIEDIKWIFSKRSNINNLTEEITLSVLIAGKNTLMVSRERNSQMHSRKLVKHALASEAMAIIFQDCDIPWHDMSVKDKKEILSRPDISTSQVDSMGRNFNSS